MSGRKYGDPALRPCPYCGLPCDADWVDVGVGEVQCGPYVCDACGASQMGPEQWDEGFVPPDGSKAGWYPPEGPVSLYANTCNGMIVNHHVAKALYRMGLLDEKEK